MVEAWRGPERDASIESTRRPAPGPRVQQCSISNSSLTERQKECLRLVLRGYKDKEIAREVGIHHETVRKHLKGAMQRLGTNSRFVAARRLADFEAHNPSGVPPVWAILDTVVDDAELVSTSPASFENAVVDVQLEERGGVLREARTPYERVILPSGEGFRAPERGPAGVSPMGRLAMAVVLILLIAMAVISAIPMSNAVQQMANAIDPP